MFHDCAIHDIDMCCWVVGEFPVEVYAMAEAHIDDIRKLNDVDTVLISMRFPSGTLATIDLSRFAAYGYDQRLEVSPTPFSLSVCVCVCVSWSFRVSMCACLSVSDQCTVLYEV